MTSSPDGGGDRSHDTPRVPHQGHTDADGAFPRESVDAPAARRVLPTVEGSPVFARLAETAAQLVNAAAAQVSLVIDEQVVFAGAGRSTGLVDEHTPLADALCALTAKGREPLLVTDAAAAPRVSGKALVAAGVVGAYAGVPLVFQDGTVVGALCVFDPVPRAWTPEEVALLRGLAAAAAVELESANASLDYQAERLAWELAIDAGRVGTFDWDLETGTLTWDDRLMDQFGYDENSFDATIESFTARLHPDDLPRVTRALQDAITACGEFAAEYRIVRPDGTTRWLAGRGRVLCDQAARPVRLLGAASDTTAVRAADRRVARVLEGMPTAVFSLDRNWRFTYVNATAETLLGMPRAALLGESIWELFPGAVGSLFDEQYRAAVATGQPVVFDAQYQAPQSGWYEVRAWPEADGLSVYVVDITARRAAQDQAEEAALRASLLAEVTTELTSTMNGEEAVARLARLVVPALADWCLVTLADDEENAGSRRGLRDVGWAHVDPEALPMVERYAALRFAALTDTAYILQTLRTGQQVSVDREATEAIASVLRVGEARDLLVRLAPESFTVLPLRGRGRIVGLLTVFNGPDRGPAPAGDVATLREVADRAGLALDSSRLYRQQRDLAERLQRSMLTAPPEPDHVQVTVRYEPAVEAAQVGGDWYDAFLQADGATVLVIGDVLGHDLAAAAAMGQVRTLLRGIAAYSGRGPADVLRGLDAAMATLQLETTATAVVARLEQTADERGRGITHVRWSNAGHPPPMVINPDGSVAPLPGITADLLLGIDPDSRRVESEVTLDRGATLLLYTDGLVEKRGVSIDDGLERLRDTLADLAARELTLDELCDAVLARMLLGQPEDDVALVAVRLHPQDRPRPPEAGASRVPDGVPREPSGA